MNTMLIVRLVLLAVLAAGVVWAAVVLARDVIRWRRTAPKPLPMFLDHDQFTAALRERLPPPPPGQFWELKYCTEGGVRVYRFGCLERDEFTCLREESVGVVDARIAASRIDWLVNAARSHRARIQHAGETGTELFG